MHFSAAARSRRAPANHEPGACFGGGSEDHENSLAYSLFIRYTKRSRAPFPKQEYVILLVPSPSDESLHQLGPSFKPLDAIVLLFSNSHTILYTGIEYGIMRGVMQTARKITVEISSELLAKAQRASGTGITQTVRTGLQLVAASRTYARLRQLRGKVRFTRTLAELKAER